MHFVSHLYTTVKQESPTRIPFYIANKEGTLHSHKRHTASSLQDIQKAAYALYLQKQERVEAKRMAVMQFYSTHIDNAHVNWVTPIYE